MVSWEFPFNPLKVKQSLAGDRRTAQLRESLVLFDQLPFVDSLPFFNGGNHISQSVGFLPETNWGSIGLGGAFGGLAGSEFW